MANGTTAETKDSEAVGGADAEALKVSDKSEGHPDFTTMTNGPADPSHETIDTPTETATTPAVEQPEEDSWGFEDAGVVTLGNDDTKIPSGETSDANAQSKKGALLGITDDAKNGREHVNGDVGAVASSADTSGATVGTNGADVDGPLKNGTLVSPAVVATSEPAGAIGNPPHTSTDKPSHSDSITESGSITPIATNNATTSPSQPDAAQVQTTSSSNPNESVLGTTQPNGNSHLSHKVVANLI